MPKITLNVKGMHCASCEMLIKDALEETQGINSANASEKEGKVVIDFDNTKISQTEIDQIISEEGFEVIR
ncbi:heavy-metal-associated domain-containing protein [Candidatus Woesearchaeota archaeon]|nr:heavy-metal-associated domain-containing protein [Candidatus Woesearchaeota archaeon]